MLLCRFRPLLWAQLSGKSIDIDVITAMEIENGEDIIGYQYLHGTNADAGGFKIVGEIQDGYPILIYIIIA